MVEGSKQPWSSQWQWFRLLDRKGQPTMRVEEGPSQDRYWVPKIGNFKNILGVGFSRDTKIYSDHNHKHVLTQCHGNYIEVETLHFYAWNWNLKKFFPQILGVLNGDFWGFECLKDTQRPCWLRLWGWVWFWVLSTETFVKDISRHEWDYKCSILLD